MQLTQLTNTCIATIIRILSHCLQMLKGRRSIDYLFFFMTHGCFSENWPFKSLAGVCGNFFPDIDQVLNRVQKWYQWNPSEKLNFDSCNSNSSGSGRVELFQLRPVREIISQNRQMCFECIAMLLIFSLVKDFIKPKNLHSAAFAMNLVLAAILSHVPKWHADTAKHESRQKKRYLQYMQVWLNELHH